MDSFALSTPEISFDAVVAARQPEECVAVAAMLAAGRDKYRSVRAWRVDHAIPAASLVPAGLRVQRDFQSQGRAALLAEGGPGAIFVNEWQDGTEVLTMASDPSAADALLDAVRQLAPSAPPKDVACHIWHNGAQGPRSTVRWLRPQHWSAISRNYPAATRQRVLEFVTADPPTGSGRLVLWHGAPGTGKTNAVLALMDAWKDWCEAHVVTDPEQMFGDPRYLLNVLAHPAGRSPERSDSPWRLIVCEDADEYLRSDARQRSGPSLGRLLNATDGLLGRGAQAIVLLTTNDDVGRLHPAIVRPGRCMSQIEFGSFSPQEGSEWLGSPVAHDATLAELFQRKAQPHSAVSESLPTGAYL